tara:strand:- start:1393 stop:3918 length:2526 start_codon:yes stop_codon:yes gene_type:complete
MSFQSHGREGGFKALNVQAQASLAREAERTSKKIQGLKTLQQQYDRRDSEFIAALKDKYREEKASKDEDKSRTDKNYAEKTRAIQRNAERSKQNLNTEIKNIENEAATWSAFSTTATELLTKLAKRKQEQIIDADVKNKLDNINKWTAMEADVQSEALARMLATRGDLSYKALLTGESPEVVAYLNTRPEAVKFARSAEMIADANKPFVKDWFEDILNKSGAQTLEEKERVLKAAPTIFLKQIGLYLNDSNLIDPLRQEINKVRLELTNEAKDKHVYLLGEKDIAEDYQYWKLKRGQENEQGAFDILQKTIRNSHDSEGINRGYAGVKKYVRGMLVNPRIVESEADFEKILSLDTLANTDLNENIINPSRKWSTVFSKSEMYDIRKERLQAEKDILATEDLKAEIHSKQVKQEVRRAILEDWDASEEMKDEIFATAPGLSDKDKKDLEALTVQVGNNTDLVEQRLTADRKIRDGTFFEDDYLMLSPSLRAMDKYRKGYKQISDFVAKTGWDKATVSGTFKDFIQNDILKVQNTPGVVTPTLNRTVKPAIAEATKDFYKYISEYMDDPEIAKHGAEHVRTKAYEKITEDIISGKGKWRVDDEYKGADGKNIGDTHFPYFDGANTGQYNVKYPTAHTLDIIEEEGSEFLKTTLVIDAAHLKSQENAANKGDGLYCVEEHKDIAEKADITVTELYNDQRALVGLDKLEPSVRDEVVKSAEQIEQNNANILKLSKNIRSFDDALKARIAQKVPRLTTAMTSTSRWQLAVKNAGIPIGTYKTVEQLSTFPAGQQILGKYFGPNGNIRGGAVVGSKRRVKGGTQLVIQLPGSDPNEPRHIYLFRGDM